MRPRKLLFFFLIVFLICTFYIPILGAQAKNVIILKNALIIDGTGKEPVTGAAVMIEDDVITGIGSIDTMTLPKGAEVYDLSGATVLPGFINAHVHDYYNEKNLENLENWAKEGVTTVRDLGAYCEGDSCRDIFNLRNEINKNPKYARLVAAGVMVTVPGGYPITRETDAITVDSPQDAAKKVNTLLDEGADIVKIAMESGLIFGQEMPVLSVEEVKAIVETAHKRGTLVTVHISTTGDLEKAIQGGVDDIAHMSITTVSQDLMETMVKRNIYWEPTLELWKGVGTRYQIAVKNLSRFYKAGGKVALGTDYAGARIQFEMGMPLKEMNLMLSAGMSPMDIIVAGTKNAAYVCNMGNKIGTLERGKIADILVVNGNPLEDIGVLKNTLMVIHNGKVIVDRKSKP